MRHIVKYHLLLPGAVVAVLLLLGRPVGSAVGIGLAVGCASMVLMGGKGHSGHRRHLDETDSRARITTGPSTDS